MYSTVIGEKVVVIIAEEPSIKNEGVHSVEQLNISVQYNFDVRVYKRSGTEFD